MVISGEYDKLLGATLRVCREIQRNPHLREHLHLVYDVEVPLGIWCGNKADPVDPHTPLWRPEDVERHTKRELLEYLHKAAPREILLRHDLLGNIKNKVKARGIPQLRDAVAETWHVRSSALSLTPVAPPATVEAVSEEESPQVSSRSSIDAQVLEPRAASVCPSQPAELETEPRLPLVTSLESDDDLPEERPRVTTIFTSSSPSVTEHAREDYAWSRIGDLLQAPESSTADWWPFSGRCGNVTPGFFQSLTGWSTCPRQSASEFFNEMFKAASACQPGSRTNTNQSRRLCGRSCGRDIHLWLERGSRV